MASSWWVPTRAGEGSISARFSHRYARTAQHAQAQAKRVTRRRQARRSGGRGPFDRKRRLL